MPVYEVRFKVSAIRRRLIHASDEDVASNSAEERLMQEMGLDRKEVQYLDSREMGKDEVED